MTALAIDLFCGLGGWTDGLLAEGYDVIGFDIERHQYSEHRYPAQLVIQDVCTLHGSQFKDAALIVASPPCQEYSYMAMPWSLAKAKAKAIRSDTTGEKLAALNRLFNECFRIQKEASFAAGRHIPLIVENVRGAQKWVGRARWNFGSFYLWGDVPALMPITLKASKVPGISWSNHGKPGYVGQAFNGTAADRLGDGIKTGDAGWRERGPGRQLQDRAIKNNGGSWFNIAHNTTSGKGQNPDGRKVGGDWFGTYAEQKAQGTISPGRLHGKNSTARKMASALIAKIPLPLSRHIAATFR